MKKFRILLMAFIVSAATFYTQSATAQNSDEELLQDIKTFAESFEQAMETPNYAEAKQALDELFPLIKKEMKVAKKEVNTLKKNGEKARAEAMEAALDRKAEIHDQLHGIVDESSAGLRVRADNVKSLVSEYVSLLGDKKKLVSSNN